MPRIFTPNYYSLSTKVILSLVFFIFLFLMIRFSLIIPKVQEESYNNEIKDITRSLFLIKEQMKMATKSIRMQTTQEIDLIKEKIVSKLKDIKMSNKDFEKKELIKLLNESGINQYCGYQIISKNFTYKKIKGKDLFRKNNSAILNTWLSHEKKELDNNSLKRKRIYLFFNTKLNSNILISLGCHFKVLNKNHVLFEKDLRIHLQKNLSLMENTKSAKTVILWINKSLFNDDSKALYEENEKKARIKYRISKLSNTRILSTGDLTTKEILAARDQNPLEYTVNNKILVSWFLDLSLDKNKDLYTLIYTLDKKDILEKSNSNLFVLLPETLISIIISFILILFIFKRLFKNINTLTKTAIIINQGNKNIRSMVKGKDDVAQLGIVFDSMLDFFENNIKILDLKVEEKTLKLKNSLEEKEILLKEVHHRVKNNLALTITFIELQENNLDDQKTKKALVDIKERIYAIELLHRKIYESKDLNKIPLKEYLKDLVYAILAAYNQKNSLSIDFDIENIELNIQEAMPYGLIINELLTNAIKYAFKNNDKAKLEIKVSKIKNKITMIVKDNGKGFENGFPKNSKTLGLKLINTIIRFQLSGTLEYVYDEGAKFIITGIVKEINKENSF